MGTTLHHGCDNGFKADAGRPADPSACGIAAPHDDNHRSRVNAACPPLSFREPKPRWAPVNAIVRPQRMCITKVGHMCPGQLSDQIPPNGGPLMALVRRVPNGPDAVR